MWYNLFTPNVYKTMFSYLLECHIVNKNGNVYKDGFMTANLQER